MKTAIQTIEAPAVALTSRQLPLHDLESVRRELASIYRAAKGGQIELGDATKLAYILNTIRQGFEQARLEQRVALVENLLTQQAKRDAEQLEHRP